MDKLVETLLRRIIRRGTLEVEFAHGHKAIFGDGTGAPLGFKFLTTAAEARMVRDPELAFGELFTDGQLIVTKGELIDLLVLAASNVTGVTGSLLLEIPRRLRTLLRPVAQFNNFARARKNVAHHYDIDARVYDLFLDSDRQYSCAYFEHDGASLEEAQLAKKRHIAAKLLLEPGQRVLDIGCGWGGLGLYLAKMRDARVTGVTLSREQLVIAQKRAKEADLAHPVDFRFQDYRDIAEKYDRVVSVGMFEHVGIGYFVKFFEKVAESLTDSGVALIHTIGKIGPPVATNPWMTKYIFPGGYTPSMSEVLPAVEKAGLIVSDVEVLRLHYAETLKAWRERFMARREEAKALYDERFCRMWEFYLAGCEASFRVGDLAVYQFQLCKKVDVVPLTRDYIGDAEAELRLREAGPPRLRLAGE